MMISDPTKRFSDRVDNYVKYRPGYPAEVISYIKNEFKLPANPVVADVGAGTGIFSKLLLGAGFTVYAVEPNGPMLIAAIEQLSGNKKFIPTIGTADATTLPDKSVDCIVCAQAFHWFNNDLTRDEFKRILKDGGQVALIWIDYNKVNHQNIGDIDFKAFFKGGQYQLKKFPNEQVFDEEGLTGRAFSSSYVPPEDTEDGKKFLELLKDVFNRYNVNGKVSFKYQTEVYSGSV
jgi:SAM-dependent methyltransferase